MKKREADRIHVFFEDWRNAKEKSMLCEAALSRLVTLGGKRVCSRHLMLTLTDMDVLEYTPIYYALLYIVRQARPA